MAIRLSDHFTYGRLLKFTFPSMVTMVFTSLYGVVDGLFVTNFAGKSALAAINFVFPILMILSTFGYMFGTGGSALVAKTLGEGKTEKANRLFSLFVYLCGGLGGVFAVVGFFILRPLMSLLGAEGEMLDQAVMYGNILLLAMPFWNWQFLFQIFFVTAEKPKLGLYVTLLAGVTNMVLDALFVGLFNWGLAGAAIATAMSQVVGGGIPLIYFFQKNDARLHLGKTLWDNRSVQKAATNGLSEFVSSISNSLVSILFNTQLLAFAGEDGVAAYSIMMYVTLVFIGIFFGYANGSSPVVSYHYGAQNHAELKNLLRKGLVLCSGIAAAMLAVSELLSVPLSMIFAGYDADLYAMTLRGFRIYALSYLFSGVAILGPSFFTALNNGPLSALLSFLRTIVFQVACVLILPRFFGVEGIWWSVVIAEALAMTASGVAFAAMKKTYRY